MSENTLHHVGYSSFQDLLDQAKGRRTLYLIAGTQHHPTNSVGRMDTHLTLSYLDGAVHCYCRVHVSSLATVGGQPLDINARSKAMDRAEKMYQALRTYLELDLGYTVHHGMVALPKDVQLFDGGYEPLVYHSESDTWTIDPEAKHRA